MEIPHLDMEIQLSSAFREHYGLSSRVILKEKTQSAATFQNFCPSRSSARNHAYTVY